ncbi:tetratricopeptide-like helical domain-containing protein [Artemisia annua]|uniref:Tetratricopeptide-like helical domain-containing protein n=1 Tax=Artemisia annua TaxID=35608 RepID=A0A2U1KW51_ARTAN|nr:tetratricopeptide-like helical domain-containing protein [Artemisia annua]
MMKGNKSFLHVLKNPPLSLGLRIQSNYYYCTSNNDESSKVANLADALKVFEWLKSTQAPVEKYNEFLGVVNKMKHYSTSVDLFKEMCSLGLPVDYDTMKTVINSCCQLRCTNKGGFAVFGCCKRGVINS